MALGSEKNRKISIMNEVVGVGNLGLFRPL